MGEQFFFFSFKKIENYFHELIFFKFKRLFLKEIIYGKREKREMRSKEHLD